MKGEKQKKIILNTITKAGKENNILFFCCYYYNSHLFATQRCTCSECTWIDENSVFRLFFFVPVEMKTNRYGGYVLSVSQLTYSAVPRRKRLTNVSSFWKLYYLFRTFLPFSIQPKAEIRTRTAPILLPNRPLP